MLRKKKKKSLLFHVKIVVTKIYEMLHYRSCLNFWDEELSFGFR